MSAVKHFVISYEQAKQQGLMFYFTGRSCKHGHFSLRYVFNKSCVECIRKRSAKAES